LHVIDKARKREADMRDCARQAAAGAVRAIDFFSGKGNEALSSLAAAAGGGVTFNSGVRRRNCESGA